MITINNENEIRGQNCLHCEIVPMYETAFGPMKQENGYAISFLMGRCIKEGRRPSMAIIALTEPSLTGWKFTTRREQFCSAVGEGKWQRRCNCYQIVNTNG